MVTTYVEQLAYRKKNMAITPLKKAIVLSAASALVLSVAACSDDTSGSDDGGVSEIATAAGIGGAEEAPEGLPDEWTWASGTDIPTEEATPSLPVTVTDGTGTEVTIKDASKIIAAGDDVADIVASLGLAGDIYAAPEDSITEAAQNAKEHFEFSQSTGTEGLLSMGGTFFIGNNVKRHGDVAEQFRSAGVDAAVYDDQQPTADKIRKVGEFLGAKEPADKVASKVEEQLKEASGKAGDNKDLNILQVTSSGAGGADAVVGSGTAGADIVEALGANSVGVDSGLRGYSVDYSDEGLLGTNPDVILIGDADLAEWGGEEGFWEAFPTLRDTPAGKDGRVIVMPSQQLKVSGPAIGAGAIALADALNESK